MFACLYSPPGSGVPLDVLERVARDFSPRIEICPEPDRGACYEPGRGACPEPGRGDSIDSLVLLDISGLDRLIGEPRVIAEELQRAVVVRSGSADTAGLKACTTTVADTAGLKACTTTVADTAGRKACATTHVAVAGTRIAAQLLARHLPGLTVIEPGSESAAIATLPLCALIPLGAPLDLVTVLERWGLRTLGEFAALPAKPLASRLDSDGLVWQRVARGEDSGPLVPARLEERFEDMLDLEWPIEGIEPLAFVLGRLLDPLCARLERRDRAVAAITLRLRVAVSRSWQTRRLEMPSPMREPRMLRTLLCLDLEGHPEVLLGPDGNLGGIDRVGLFIEPTPGHVAQFSLLTRPAVAPEAVATLMARLRALIGQDRCGIARVVDTHRPGAFTMAEFVMANLSNSVNPTNLVNLVNPVNPKYPRALRRLRHPIPARVVVEHGRPIRVVTDRRGWSGGRVNWCAGPWRASGDWWKPETARACAPYSWQEWDVALSDGGHYRIHEDRFHAQWFLDAILD